MDLRSPPVAARIMGILNVTPDSFSDGGEWFDVRRARSTTGARSSPRGPRSSTSAASRRARAREPVAMDEELRRVVPVIAALRGSRRAAQHRHREARPSPRRRWTPARRSSTTSPPSASEPELAGFVADRGCDCCLMHMLGEPRTMQHDPRYDDVVDDVRAFLEERVDVRGRARACARSASWSTRASASARRSSTTSSCCAAWTRSRRSGCPVVLGTSRKSFLGRLTGREDPHDRVAGDGRHQRPRARARGARLPRPRRRRHEGRPRGGGCYVARRWRLRTTTSTTSSRTTRTTTTTSGGPADRGHRRGHRPLALHPPRRQRGRARGRPAPRPRPAPRGRRVRRDGHRPGRGHRRLRGGLRARRARRPAALLQDPRAPVLGVADRLLADFAAEEVWVKATKPEPPIPLPVEEVSVEVWRQAPGRGSERLRARRRRSPRSATAPGARRASRAWSASRGPNGGYLAAIVLRAMAAELDDPARAAALADLPLPAPAARRRAARRRDGRAQRALAEHASARA